MTDSRAQYRIGVDIGGTFTDCVTMDAQGTVTVGKALSTPEDYSVGTLNAVRQAAESLGLADEAELLASTRLFFHACTIGDNALITGSGAVTGLITTKGFADTLQIMRGRFTDGVPESEIFHLSVLDKPKPMVPRPLIKEVDERVDYKGAVLVRLDPAQVEKAVAELVSGGVEAIAVSLIWSVANDSHERVIAGIMAKEHPGVFLSLSSEVAPYLGEYERTATTVFNACIGPRISAYIKRLGGRLREQGLAGEPLIMQSYGGVLGVEATARNAIGTIESGPAAGVTGSAWLGRLMDVPDILATDMGGTTFKVSVIRDGVVEMDYKPVMLRHQIYSTKIWVESIGAGGGSIAWTDDRTGLLKVGPEGAGAQPGPACYGLGGTEPTVSDADLVLGFLNPGYFLGGRMSLDRERAWTAIEQRVAKPLGLSVEAAAGGIYRIINAHMSDLIRRATVERGYDPRDFTLFAFGGAGPVHAARYAAELGIKQVVVPLTASVHSATGLVSSDIVYQYGKSDRLLVPADHERVNRNFDELVRRARADLSAAGFEGAGIRIERSLDMRYRYQVHELNVAMPEGDAALSEQELDRVYERFDDLYESTYGPGSGYREAGKEIMNFRLTATGVLDKPQLQKYPLSSDDASGAVTGRRKVFFEEFEEPRETPVYGFDELRPGNEMVGPAIIETPVTTIVVNPGHRAAMDAYRNVRLLIGD